MISRDKLFKKEHVIISNEPAHEIMALFILRKHILQTRMRNHPVGLDVWFLVRGLSSISILLSVWKLWRDSEDAQARLSLRWSPVG